MRITMNYLEASVRRINEITGNKLEPYTDTGIAMWLSGNRFKINIGNYHLSGAYGGWALYQMETKGGGVKDIFECGHVPKKELYNRMDGFIKGLSGVIK